MNIIGTAKNNPGNLNLVKITSEKKPLYILQINLNIGVNMLLRKKITKYITYLLTTYNCYVPTNNVNF